MIPSVGLGLQLEFNKYQAALSGGWDWTPQVRSCALIALDPLGQMYMVISVAQPPEGCYYLPLPSCPSKCGGGEGAWLTRDHGHVRPADTLIAGWDRGKPAALDVTVHHPSALPSWENQAKWRDAGNQLSNGPKWVKLGWTCIPIAVDTYKGGPGDVYEAPIPPGLQQASLRTVVADIYSRLWCQSHSGKLKKEPL